MKIRFRNRKGVSLYFTVILLSVILTISLGLTSILISQMKGFQGLGNSTKAFYAADSGVEKALLHYGEDGYLAIETLKNKSSYNVVQSCDTNNCTVDSSGNFSHSKRRIEVNYSF